MIFLAQILSGKTVAEQIKQDISNELQVLKQKGILPTLGIILAGEEKDSLSYAKGAKKRCEGLGLGCKIISLPADISFETFKEKIIEINNCEDIHGYIIMKPLPSQIDEKQLGKIIAPEKDIDCMSPENMAKIFAGDESGYAPCTAQAVIEILKYYNIPIRGQRAVIIGRSLVVGKPLSMLLLKENATVTICHTKTRDLAEEAKRADILIAAAGKAEMVTEDMVSPEAIVIDVGINFKDGKMVGDVCYDKVKDNVSAITPVPGGVGSVTTLILLKQLIKAAKRKIIAG